MKAPTAERRIWRALGGRLRATGPESIEAIGVFTPGRAGVIERLYLCLEPKLAWCQFDRSVTLLPREVRPVEADLPVRRESVRGTARDLAGFRWRNRYHAPDKVFSVLQAWTTAIEPVLVVEPRRTGSAMSLVADVCPFCGDSHTHGGGPVGGNWRALLGFRVPHCLPERGGLPDGRQYRLVAAPEAS